MFICKLLSTGLTHQTPTIRMEAFAGLRKLRSNEAIRSISETPFFLNQEFAKLTSGCVWCAIITNNSADTLLLCCHLYIEIYKIMMNFKMKYYLG